MRDHDSGKTLTFGADTLDRIMHGLLSGDRDALILADEINTLWRAAVTEKVEEKPWHWYRISSTSKITCYCLSDGDHDDAGYVKRPSGE